MPSPRHFGDLHLPVGPYAEESPHGAGPYLRADLTGIVPTLSTEFLQQIARSGSFTAEESDAAACELAYRLDGSAE